MELSREELLVLLVEECGEVIQAATKCLRFGWDRNQPGYGVNCEVLADEVGDLGGVIDALNLDHYRIVARGTAKIAKAARIKAMIAAEAGPISRRRWLWRLWSCRRRWPLTPRADAVVSETRGKK